MIEPFSTIYEVVTINAEYGGDLEGFNGGTITGVSADFRVYENLGGRIAPVPEPGTLGLSGTSVIGLAGMVRRKLRLEEQVHVFQGVVSNLTRLD